MQLGLDFGIKATGSLIDVAPEYRSNFVFGKKLVGQICFLLDPQCPQQCTNYFLREAHEVWNDFLFNTYVIFSSHRLL